MSIEEIIIDKVRILPPDKQQKTLDFIVGFAQLNLLTIIGLKQRRYRIRL